MTQPFYFPDGRLAHNTEDLLELCQQSPDEGTNFLIGQDLEKWLAYIGSYDVAECAANARQSELEDRQKLEEFLNRSHSLTMAQAVPAAVTETQTSSEPNAPQSALEEAEGSAEVQSPSSSQPTQPAIEESKQLAQVESVLAENQEESIETPVSSSKTTEPLVGESKQLAKVESALIDSSDQSATPKPDKEVPQSADEEKPSFFQVIAKFIVKILYRNKA